MSPILQVNNVSRFYAKTPGRIRAGQVRALHGVSLNLEPGRTLALAGASGAGKSTLARLVAGMEVPDHGDIIVDGRSLAARQWDRRFRKRIQMIFQDPFAAVNPFMTIRDIIAEPLEIHNGIKNSAVDDHVSQLMRTVGLNPALMKREPGRVSGGELQRVCIARALALEPDLLVADEPVASLDAPLRAGILDLLRRIQREQGLSMVLVAHDLQLVDRVSDTVAILLHGTVVEQGPTGDVLSQPMHPYTKLLIKAMIPGAELELAPDDDNGEAGQDERCPFRAQCPEAMPSCDKLPPPTRKHGEHAVTCFLMD